MQNAVFAVLESAQVDALRLLLREFQFHLCVTRSSVLLLICSRFIFESFEGDEELESGSFALDSGFAAVWTWICVRRFRAGRD